MDDLTTLRRLDAGTPAPTDAALASAYGRLAARMDDTATVAPFRRPVRRGLLLTGLGVAAAACIAVALVDLGPAPSATAAGRTLQAAATTVAASDADAPSDLEVHYTRLVTSGGGEVDGQPQPESAVLLEGTLTQHRQGDSDVWTRTTNALEPIDAYGPAAARLRQQAQDEADDWKPIVERSSDSKWFWDITPKQVAALPRDPAALSRRLQGLTADPESGSAPNTERAIDNASTILGSGLADAQLQAAVYEALKDLPGLLLDEHATDLDGREGVAIGTLVSNGQQRIDIVIDPATGRFLGRTETNVKAINGAPAGTAYESTAVYPR